jgi:hypothetical protein
MFKKIVENFTCEHCGEFVIGNGFTNHCPLCLWSKHVDITPGDRAAACGGLMEPVKVEGGSPDYVLVHRCTRCGIERRNRVQPDDSTDAVIALSKKLAHG